jgi:hypothetical protein
VKHVLRTAGAVVDEATRTRVTGGPDGSTLTDALDVDHGARANWNRRGSCRVVPGKRSVFVDTGGGQTSANDSAVRSSSGTAYVPRELRARRTRDVRRGAEDCWLRRSDVCESVPCARGRKSPRGPVWLSRAFFSPVSMWTVWNSHVGSDVTRGLIARPSWPSPH